MKMYESVQKWMKCMKISGVLHASMVPLFSYNVVFAGCMKYQNTYSSFIISLTLSISNPTQSKSMWDLWMYQAAGSPMDKCRQATIFSQLSGCNSTFHIEGKIVRMTIIIKFLTIISSSFTINMILLIIIMMIINMLNRGHVSLSQYYQSYHHKHHHYHGN